VGWGVAARIEVAGVERFSRAQRWWQDWCRNAQIEDAVGVPGSGPVAFASFAFDPEPGTSTVVVPRVVLGRRGDQTWMTIVGEAPEALQTITEPTIPGVVEWRDGSRPRDDWQGAVAEAISRINRGELDKVVLARDIVGVAPEAIDIRYVLRRLAQDYPSCWTFSVDGLVGATPELLVRRSGDDVTSRVLAGTVKRRGEASVDEGLARALLGSDKDLEEHKYAVHSVARALAAHCTDLNVPARPHVLRLANVQHLATDVTGRLADSAPVLALAASLHPTAAVCGTPTERALALIRETEGMDRGRYSGPVGWFDAHGDGEFGIALRCAEFDGAHVRAFAGCGIVAGSDPDSELAESAAKLLPIRNALSLD
jgi:menaquinone-specific isochorismate synthase